MLLKWFDAREATAVGSALADQFLPESATAPRRGKSNDPQSQLKRFLQRVDQEAGPLKLNVFTRAKLANAFRWRLAEAGLETETVNELTRMLVQRLAVKRTPDSGSSTAAAVPAAGPRQIQGLLAQGNEHGARGELAQARECFAQVLEINPSHVVARNNLGVALLKLGRYQEAEEQFRRAVGSKPGYAEGQFNLGTVLRLRGRFVESEAPLRRALKLNPRHTEAQVSLGLTLILNARLKDARECFERALKGQPRHAGALSGLRQVASIEGRFDEALELYKRAVEADPKMSSAWAALPALRKMTAADAAWRDRAEALAAGGLAPLEEADLRFALGKYYDDLGDYARAFSSYQRANELHGMAADPYDRAEHTAFVDDMIRVYTREALGAPQPGGSDSTRPLFVVGMMRSGTSLVEQIIASHPSAFGAGELSFWANAMRRQETTLRRELLDTATRKKLADAYLEVLKAQSATAARVIDKATFNSDYLGPIHTVFPHARMIHVRRDPIDACLSCYFQQFPASLNFTTDLSNLAHYYREHHRLIEHWRSVLPRGVLLDVPYAELVADPERWTRAILEFAGLEWDPRCLEFQQTQRPVLTASSWQVRQKIYKGSVGRWHNYRKFIGPLLELEGLA